MLLFQENVFIMNAIILPLLKLNFVKSWSIQLHDVILKQLIVKLLGPGLDVFETQIDIKEI